MNARQYFLMEHNIAYLGHSTKTVFQEIVNS
jgi:hypothetical protein